LGPLARGFAPRVVPPLQGAPGIAVGNVVGSNIANVGLILGLTAAFYPLMTKWGFIRREAPFLLAATGLAVVLFVDGALGRLEGAVLLLGLAIFLTVLFRAGDAPDPEAAAERGSAGKAALMAILGIGVLVAAAQALVTGAVSLAQALGVSERVIGLTMVAVGTSLPELASSLVAALRRETDIILGNIVGSNVFNLLAVLGIAAVVEPIGVETGPLRLDLVVMSAFTLVVVGMVLRRPKIGRPEGLVLLAAYVLYVGFLFAA
jgi:cation:H+ antiporter